MALGLSVEQADSLIVRSVELAIAAREADLHIALFGISILKARFYNSIGTPWQPARSTIRKWPMSRP